MYCNDCEEDISDFVAKYSKDYFNIYLCKECQENHKKVSAKSNIIIKSSNPPEPTPEAIKLFNALKTIGVKVKSKYLEKWDGYKHIDIAIVDAKLNLEVDGCQHNLNKAQALADLKRTYYSFKKGYLTLRIPNSLVRDDARIKETARYIKEIINTRKEQIDEDDSWIF